MEQLIKVVQLPQIEERLRSLSEDIDKQVQEATSLVCTEETVKSVKTVRASLNKRLAALEEQRMAVKKAILEPYEAFEKVYKECVKDKFVEADTTLKKKIDEVENGLKADKEVQAKKYYAELCEAYGIDFYPWEKAGIKVTLSTSMKGLQEQIQRGLNKVMDDLEIISQQQYKDEILAEYKQCLNLNQAISHINDIHASIEAEKAKQEENTAKEERAAEAVKKVEALATPVEKAPPATDADPVLTLSFRVTAAKSKLRLLKKFLIDGGYEVE